MFETTHKKLFIASVILLGSSLNGNLQAAENTLSSIKIDSTVILDGVAEPLWQKASALQVKVDKLPYQANNYSGIKETQVSLKSLYDNEHIYFLVQYSDPTKSLQRFPWQKQSDGQWKQLKDKDQTGHSNNYYEDKFAFFWDIKAPGFAKKGCAVACHLVNDDGKINGIDQKGKTAGRKYTRRAGETLDMWHWKSVRMNPLGIIDDQFVDHVKDPAVNKNWGRHGDSKTGGGYVNNTNKDKSGPAFMNRTQDGLNDFTIVPSQKTPFVDTFKSGDLIPGIMSEVFTGSRGDIWAKGNWENGVWTIEIKRKLVTTGDKANSQDVQFTDLSKIYPFAISVFDNSQINHVYHDGSLALSFK
ncbi:ethylbenzene dehydrogenase-related protein [Psychromonas sp. Urea-02u-13]|uniref:ethylbenzene dehydrogenase-related protein n=1 Tax=Psychromonas sp. Urea-02u-13 TaxID=2058326 RepID=UPI000C322B5B|nr:ethylbenzene dehydrogenase-related protein [Psychromonas sp. Urea-02u-13]PKG40469.1 ethylbenzene dehydrogenase [Psychromonas sp. Urea-02u-13]